MERAGTEPAVVRAWRIQLLHCGLVGVLLCIVPFAVHRRLGAQFPVKAFDRSWLLSSSLILAYMVERTRYDWKQLRFVRSLGGELPTEEFRMRRARERFHRKALIAALVLGFFLLMLVTEGLPLALRTELLAVVLILLIKSVLEAWLDLRQIEVDPFEDEPPFS
ncbi:MAG TPA: hypothetical protein VH250_04925 [Granulicella sp.]|jgi:hypothetical protein|nr:hypothetical protein [Granulicella sp.]